MTSVTGEVTFKGIALLGCRGEDSNEEGDIVVSMEHRLWKTPKEIPLWRRKRSAGDESRDPEGSSGEEKP